MRTSFAVDFDDLDGFLGKDFVSSLFWVLESKRLSAMATVDKERQPLLCAPFERKDLIGQPPFHSLSLSLCVCVCVPSFTEFDWQQEWIWTRGRTASAASAAGASRSATSAFR